LCPFTLLTVGLIHCSVGLAACTFASFIPWCTLIDKHPLVQTQSFSMIGSFRSSISATFLVFRQLLTTLTLRRLDKEVAFVSASPSIHCLVAYLLKLPVADIPCPMERRENRILILSLLPTRRLTFPLLGSYRESRCNCLSEILPRSLCMYNAYGALSHPPCGVPVTY
jgi:hypothetical protein